MENPEDNQAIKLNNDSMLFPDDTGIDYKTHEKISPEILEYG